MCRRCRQSPAPPGGAEERTRIEEKTTMNSGPEQKHDGAAAAVSRAQSSSSVENERRRKKAAAGRSEQRRHHLRRSSSSLRQRRGGSSSAMGASSGSARRALLLFLYILFFCFLQELDIATPLPDAAAAAVPGRASVLLLGGVPRYYFYKRNHWRLIAAADNPRDALSACSSGYHRLHACSRHKQQCLHTAVPPAPSGALVP